MVKDAPPLKKKRKSSLTVDGDHDTDIYKKVVEYEEKEAATRNSHADSKIFGGICQDARKLINDIFNPKKKLDASKRRELLVNLCMKVAVIRKLNRVDKIQHCVGKEVLNGEKLKCDSIKLNYQNLVYELDHIVQDINKCRSFRSKHEEIDLIELPDFLNQASPEVSEQFKAAKLEEPDVLHSLTLARLEFELEQRKALAKDLEALQEDKKRIAVEVTVRKNKLDGLLPLLKNIIGSTKPLQEYLNISTDKTRAEHKMARLLPDALYTLYANAVAYSSVYNIHLEATILGDEDEAVRFNEALSLENVMELESDDEAQEQEVEVEVKKRRHRKSVQVDPMEEKRNRLLEVHPLAVKLALGGEGKPTIFVEFQYCVRLKIVVVGSKVELPSSLSGDLVQELLSGESILSELRPGDFGRQSPNSSNAFQLKKVGISSFESLIPKIGYAYKWAQSCCGIDFLSKSPVSEDLAETNIHFIFKCIVKRLASRTQLATQLQRLADNSTWDFPDNTGLPKNVVSSLSRFSSGSYHAFCEAEYTRPLLEEDLITTSDIFFWATVRREGAQLDAHIVIKHTYPESRPLFCLCLKKDGGQASAANSESIREIERVINHDLEVGLGQTKTEDFLALQIYYLRACLDVHVEIGNGSGGQQGVMFFRPTSGRNRRSPFRFKNIGTGFFSQY